MRARDVAQQPLQVEGGGFELQVPGLDLREVEHVVQDGEQCGGRRPQGGEVVALALVARQVERQVGHADDAVHRRADLVAHVGEKLALHAAGALGGVARLAQLAAVLLDAAAEGGNGVSQAAELVVAGGVGAGHFGPIGRRHAGRHERLGELAQRCRRPRARLQFGLQPAVRAEQLARAEVETARAQRQRTLELVVAGIDTLDEGAQAEQRIARLAVEARRRREGLEAVEQRAGGRRRREIPQAPELAREQAVRRVHQGSCSSSAISVTVSVWL